MDVETTFEWEPENKYSVFSTFNLTVYESYFTGVNATQVDLVFDGQEIDSTETYEDLLEKFDGNVTEAEEALEELIEDLPLS